MKDGDLVLGARPDSSLPHECGVPTRNGTPHSCGRKQLRRNIVFRPPGLVWFFLVCVLAGVESAKVVDLLDPLGMAITKVHTSTCLAVVVIFVGPVIMGATRSL